MIYSQLNAPFFSGCDSVTVALYIPLTKTARGCVYFNCHTPRNRYLPALPIAPVCVDFKAVFSLNKPIWAFSFFLILRWFIPQSGSMPLSVSLNSVAVPRHASLSLINSAIITQNGSSISGVSVYCFPLYGQTLFSSCKKIKIFCTISEKNAY